MAKQRCGIDTLPPEIISDILLNVIDSFGDAIRLKWEFSLLVRRVSNRFYHITIRIQSLWRYLYIRQPLHPYLHNHIAHSGALPLMIHAVYTDAIADENWAEITDIVIRLSQRLRTLVLDSPAGPINEILGHDMPLLEGLHIEGRINKRTAKKFLASHFPSLRFLRCDDFCFEWGERFPETLEELHLMDERVYDNSRLWHSAWTLLPKTIRVLRINGTMWGGIGLPLGERIHLPCLAELSFTEYLMYGKPSILQYLDAPRLQTLDVCSLDDSDPILGVGSPDWSLDFPELVHIHWQAWPNGPRMDHILRRCTALKSVHIKIRRLSMPSHVIMWISCFVDALADDKTLLPVLEDFVVRGASIPSLKSLVHARPWLKHRLKVHWRNLLGFEVQAFREDYIDWQKCDAHLDV